MTNDQFEKARTMAREVLNGKVAELNARTTAMRDTVTIGNIEELRLMAETLRKAFSYRDIDTGVWQEAAYDVALQTADNITLLCDMVDSVEDEDDE